MTEIRATCETCGDLQLGVDDLTLRLCVDTAVGEFHFTCAECSKVTAQSVSGPTFDLLQAAGVSCDEWNLPQELFEQRSGPRITHDDLLEFHGALNDDESFAAAMDSLIRES